MCRYRLLIDRSQVRVLPGALHAPVAQLAEQFGRHHMTAAKHRHHMHRRRPCPGRGPEGVGYLFTGEPMRALPDFRATTAVSSWKEATDVVSDELRDATRRCGRRHLE